MTVPQVNQSPAPLQSPGPFNDPGTEKPQPVLASDKLKLSGLKVSGSGKVDQKSWFQKFIGGCLKVVEALDFAKWGRKDSEYPPEVIAQREELIKKHLDDAMACTDPLSILEISEAMLDEVIDSKYGNPRTLQGELHSEFVTMVRRAIDLSTSRLELDAVQKRFGKILDRRIPADGVDYRPLYQAFAARREQLKTS